MNFEHTEDRRMLSDMLRRFVAEQYDIATRHRNAGAERGHSPEFWRRYAELGAIGALFAERDGGLGGAGFDIAVVFEALGRGRWSSPSWTRSWWAAPSPRPARRRSANRWTA